MSLKRSANVLDPTQARSRRGKGAIDSELVTQERNIVPRGLAGGKRDDSLHTLRVPALFTIVPYF
jgi:hypothetical protein